MAELDLQVLVEQIRVLEGLVPNSDGDMGICQLHGRTGVFAGDRRGFIRLAAAILRYAVDAHPIAGRARARSRTLKHFFRSPIEMLTLFLELDENPNLEKGKWCWGLSGLALAARALFLQRRGDVWQANTPSPSACASGSPPPLDSSKVDLLHGPLCKLEQSVPNAGGCVMVLDVSASTTAISGDRLGLVRLGVSLLHYAIHAQLHEFKPGHLRANAIRLSNLFPPPSATSDLLFQVSERVGPRIKTCSCPRSLMSLLAHLLLGKK